MKYGNVFTTSDYTDALLKSNRTQSGLKTWSQMYGSIDLAAQQADAALRSNYANEVSEAYANSHAQKSAIYSSNLSEGYKAAAATEIDAALNEAYESYRSNYNKSLLDVEASKADAQSKVTELLTQQAENTKNYEQAHLDYLQYLWSGVESGELTDKDVPADLWTQPGWSRLTATDEQGNVTGLLSEDEIRSMMYDENDNLTLKGVDIYDMIENDLSNRGYKSFGSFLAEQDEANKTNLVEWATSYNPYDYNDAFTNAGSFKELMGMTSTDDKYLFVERFGGMTEEDIDVVIGKFDTKIANIENKIAGIEDADADSVKTEIYGLIDEVELLTKQYGLEDVSFDKYKAVIDEAFADIKSNKDDLTYYDVQTAIATSAAIISGTVGGAAVGSSVPIIGTLIGGLLGATAGYAAALEIKESREPGRQAYTEAAKYNATSAKDATLNMLTYLSMNMKKTQRERQQDIYQAFSK